MYICLFLILLLLLRRGLSVDKAVLLFIYNGLREIQVCILALSNLSVGWTYHVDKTTTYTQPILHTYSPTAYLSNHPYAYAQLSAWYVGKFCWY